MAQEPVARLKLCPWDVDRWRASRAFRMMSLAAQGAYLNLCFAAWDAQPSCRLSDDDRELWRHANAASRDEWEGVKAEAFGLSDAWAWDVTGWLNEVVLETYVESARRHALAVRSGRIAGHASARARRASSQAAHIEQVRTAVQRPLNEGSTNKSTAVNPLSLSLEKKQQTVEAPAIAPTNGNEPTSSAQAVVDFYNHITSRKLSGIHRKTLAPRLKEGTPASTLKLAILGACLQPFHLGENDRKKTYLDPATILKPERLDGHADFARRATWRIPGADGVWQFWCERLRLGREDTMRHFFQARDRVLVEEGSEPIGLAAVRSDARPGEAWPDA